MSSGEGRLVEPARDRASCGVAFVAHLSGRASRETLDKALAALVAMEHRGAKGPDSGSGDGAGITLQMPDAFLRAEAGVELPPPGRYAAGTCFLPRRDEHRRDELQRALTAALEGEGQRVLGWRDVPVAPGAAGELARACAPCIRQLFVAAGDDVEDQDEFERRLYVARRVAERAEDDLVIPSLSSRTLVYKGMLSAPQLALYFPDLRDARMASALALVHSRFSTNTFPSWGRAHPYRLIAHNGEINTLLGNVNWMRAREGMLSSSLLGEDLSKVLPAVVPGGSDSASFDNVLELLLHTGRSLPHAMMLMMPEAWEARGDLDDDLRGFYAFHSCLMEPWDGPASVSFTDGRVIGATLDRNGLRPGRWAATDDGWVVVASEAGALPLPPERVVRRGRLEPGRLFLVDLERGRMLADREAELEVARRRPYARWYADRRVPLADLPSAHPPRPEEPLASRRLAFGYTLEDVGVLLGPMIDAKKEPTGSMGNDAALAVLSERAPPLFSYFKQLFAQVTNPAIDPVREEIVMSLTTYLGRGGNLLTEGPDDARQVVLDGPVLRDDELAQLRAAADLPAVTLDATWPVAEGPAGLDAAVERICAEAAEAVADGAALLAASDRAAGPGRVPVPSLLAVAAVHHHLVRAGTRLRAALVVESGEPREVHHVACLIGYGAAAVNPYLLLESARDLAESGELGDGPSAEAAELAVVHALHKGLLKTLSKMGISTIQSYSGAQVFEAVGLARSLVGGRFPGTASRIDGVGVEDLAADALARHARAYPQRADRILPSGGVYAWRRDGEHHGWNPETVTRLQRAVGLAGPAGEPRDGHDGAVDGRAWESWERYAEAVDAASRRGTLRGLLLLREAEERLPLEEVEPASEIVKRFATGAMSLGSISPESHEALAIAMNRLGGKSNTGEGGEDPRRYTPDANGDSRRSRIKQVASARFGVTTEYLVDADELQIKVAQGSKPGEGGQLPGHKVDDYIAKLRFATPGVELISPPPHHDIYSIEDLAQLIYDLRCSNPRARVSVKLASEVGVGTVAAGVVKANSDHIVIAGHDGGTGASPLSSIQSAGIPWELGLAEAQQTLVASRLRSRVVLQVDGQLRTGRDVVTGALLGAEEFGFSTAPLIATGCIMMRVCHLNTCPVGIATQDEELRRRFAGTPEHVVRFFMLLAEDVRRLMSTLGVARFEDMVGRTDLLIPDVAHPRADRIDLEAVLAPPERETHHPLRRTREQEPILRGALDHELIEAARPAIERGERVSLAREIRNWDRCAGGLLSSEIVRSRGRDELPDDTVEIAFEGSGGQSFGAWLAPGVSLTLTGEANDYVGKGLSGGVVALRPHPDSQFRAEDEVIAGNTVLYGATAGRAFFRGRAGERFAVRNSGARAVVEGVGDHGCEYMTGGRVAVLGPTGHNFAAGMSGGIAYVLDADGGFAGRCNPELVELGELEAGDRDELRELVEEHAARTGSPVAERLLARWEDEVRRFVRVIPSAFREALQEEEGGDEVSNGGSGRVRPKAPAKAAS